jgi:hypothetical protein
MKIIVEWKGRRRLAGIKISNFHRRIIARIMTWKPN